MPVSELRRSPVEGALVGWLLGRPPAVERLPVGALEAPELAGELQRVQARRAMDAAYEAELVMALAAERPDSDDPPPGHPGARRRGAGSPVPGTSEFLPDELAMVLNCSRSFAVGHHAHHPATGPARPHRATGAARATPTTARAG